MGMDIEADGFVNAGECIEGAEGDENLIADALDIKRYGAGRLGGQPARQ